MTSPPPHQPHPPRRSLWAFAAFLVGFAVLLIGVSYYFLLPGLEALRDATPAYRAQLRAWSALLLSVILVILACGLVLTFRVGRFFFPRPTHPRTRTKYVDVWAEAGRRLTEEEPDEEGM